MSLLKNKKNILKKATFVSLLATSLTAQVVFSKENQDSLKKIHHVYINDTYIGTVSDKEALDKMVKQQEGKVAKEYKELSVDARSAVQTIPESVFNHQTNDEEVLEKVQQMLVVEASAYALILDNQPIAFVKDQQDYEETMRQLYLQFVTEDELAQWEANQKRTSPFPALNVDESRIVDISLEQPLSTKENRVVPADIMTPEQVVKFLLTGVKEQAMYEVQTNDVLGSIAKQHDLTIDELLSLNEGMTRKTVLRVGQKLNVTISKPVVNVSVVKEKRVIEPIQHKKTITEDSEMFKGESTVTQQGVDGQRDAVHQIQEYNGEVIGQSLKEEQVLEQPVEHIEIVGTKIIPSRGTGEFQWPTGGGYISSKMGMRWGAFHKGIDIARPSNYDIYAADNGEVTYVGYDGSYGEKVIINHNNGFQTVYAHLSRIDVVEGQVVPKGETIGRMGRTGNSTGVHLHFEVLENGSNIDPLDVVSK